MLLNSLFTCRDWRAGWLWLILTATLATSAAVLGAEQYRLGKDFFFLFARRDDTPMYASPSQSASVIARFHKGRKFGKEETASPSVIDKRGSNSAQWIQIKGYPGSHPDGWIRRWDFSSQDEFKRTERWPIKTYMHLWGNGYLYYRFEPNGRGKILDYVDGKPIWEEAGYIAVAEGMVILGVGPVMAYYDEVNKLLCPSPIKVNNCKTFLASPDGQDYEQKQFTPTEMDAFFKAKAEGRPPPQIDYGDK